VPRRFVQCIASVPACQASSNRVRFGMTIPVSITTGIAIEMAAVARKRGGFVFLQRDGRPTPGCAWVASDCVV